jgi:hypothetical protein
MFRHPAAARNDCPRSPATTSATLNPLFGMCAQGRKECLPGCKRGIRLSVRSSRFPEKPHHPGETCIPPTRHHSSKDPRTGVEAGGRPATNHARARVVTAPSAPAIRSNPALQIGMPKLPVSPRLRCPRIQPDPITPARQITTEKEVISSNDENRALRKGNESRLSEHPVGPSTSS